MFFFHLYLPQQLFIPPVDFKLFLFRTLNCPLSIRMRLFASIFRLCNFYKTLTVFVESLFFVNFFFDLLSLTSLIVTYLTILSKSTYVYTAKIMWIYHYTFLSFILLSSRVFFIFANKLRVNTIYLMT